MSRVGQPRLTVGNPPTGRLDQHDIKTKHWRVDDNLRGTMDASDYEDGRLGHIAHHVQITYTQKMTFSNHRKFLW